MDPLFGPDFVVLSLPPMLIATLAALACALPGNFLLLRRQAMLGDAISHVVLPGIVVAFLITGTAATLPILIGSAAAALLAVGMIEVVRRLARVDSGAAMGVTFTTLFAAGVLLLELSGAGAVHLDVEHALYGNLESLIWLDATGWASLFDQAALAGLPPEMLRIGVVLAVISALIAVFWRPLVIASFDEPYAATRGLPVRLIAAGLISVTALAAVAAFSAVGSILTIAMLICPPAAARLMTNRIGPQVAVSLVLAALSAIFGWTIAGAGPALLGLSGSVSAAGMIATTSGLMLGLAAIFGRHARST